MLSSLRYLSFDNFPQSEPDTVTEETYPSLLQKLLLSKNVFNSNEDTRTFLKDMKAASESDIWPALVTNDGFGKPRISSILRDRKQLHVAHGISLLLKGTPFFLYGDELAGESEKMKWDYSPNCGFSSSNSTETKSGNLIGLLRVQDTEYYY